MSDINWDFEWKPLSQRADIRIYDIDLETFEKIMAILDPDGNAKDVI